MESQAHEAEATTNAGEKAHTAYQTNYQLQNEFYNYLRNAKIQRSISYDTRA